MKKHILVLGADGQLGRSLYESQKYKQDFIFTFTNRKEVDIRNINSLIDIIEVKKPDIIINTAATTNVDLAETEVDLATHVNGIGPGNIAKVAKSYGVKLIHISSDYVFCGNENYDENGKRRGYRETDKTEPTTSYGKSKLLGETLIKKNMSDYLIIRTAWLYGDKSNFISKILEKAIKHEEIDVVNDQFGTPTSTNELVRFIYYAIKNGLNGLYHGSCEGETSWYEFAKKIVDCANLSTLIRPCDSDEFETKAIRPKYTVLDNYLINTTTNYRFKDWEEAVEDYFKN